MKPTAYKTRVIISGDVLEVYSYEEPIFRNLKSKKNVPAEKIPLEEMSEELLAEKLETRGRSNIRARNNIRRLALENFSHRSKFLTLTFAENMVDLEEANKRFKRFIRKLGKKYGKFKYLAVIEFQERGAIHYHIMLDIKYVKAKTLEELWGEGFIKINDIRHVDNVGAYIVKYMTKVQADERLIGKKMYQCSRNLEKPKELIGEEAEQYLLDVLDQKKKPTYESEYSHKLTETKITYREYNFRRK